MKIPAKCINDKQKPSIIPDKLWIKEGEMYNITHIYRQARMDGQEIVFTGQQGCLIEGHDISAYIPYNCFRLDRFAFTEEGLALLKVMMEECDFLNEVDIDNILEELELVEEEEFI